MDHRKQDNSPGESCNKEDATKELESAFENLHAQLPGIADAFDGLHEEAIRDGTISVKNKRLMLVAISVVLRCENCVRTHTREAIGEGASREEVLEAAGVGMLMGGGPSVSFSATKVLEALDDLGV